MVDQLKVAMAQLNPIVGDVTGNVEKILGVRRAHKDVDIIVCPELCVSGYPPEDLVLRRSYQQACRDAVNELAAATLDGGPALIIGAPWADEQAESLRPFNAAIVVDKGKVLSVTRKVCLPNYGPFDEPRTFKPGRSPEVVTVRGVKVGLMICEDLWFPEVSTALHAQGAELLIAPHGSPFRAGVHSERLERSRSRFAETSLPILFVNQCGGQDELVFDGGCFGLDGGTIKVRSSLFEACTAVAELQRVDGRLTLMEGAQLEWPDGDALVYQALVTGTRDYVLKSGFQSVVLGLSGGIDSAIVTAIAVDALGARNVHCVRLPSRFSSEGSLTDAAACAAALGVRLDTLNIERAFEAHNSTLAPVFQGRPADVTEENLQSRIRGTLVMALSNKLGSMMLTTGNKSEMSVGYATLYGDMNGGYNPLKDVYKTQVFRLCRWRNQAKPAFALGPDGEVIPEAIITKPPSAELRDDQKDEDSLPPYDILDAILHGLTEEDAGTTEMIRRGYDPDLVRRVRGLLFRAEYKRRQSGPGPKVSNRYFGRDRRYPIVNRFGDQ